MLKIWNWLSSIIQDIWSLHTFGWCSQRHILLECIQLDLNLRPYHKKQPHKPLCHSELCEPSMDLLFDILCLTASDLARLVCKFVFFHNHWCCTSIHFIMFCWIIITFLCAGLKLMEEFELFFNLTFYIFTLWGQMLLSTLVIWCYHKFFCSDTCQNNDTNLE